MCVRPKTAWRFGKSPLNFTRPIPNAAEIIQVNCGSCSECQNTYSNEWALRVSLEAKNKPSCFITLTYNKENLPSNGVEKEALQKFIKRLRKQLYKNDIDIKYFACGEYGKRNARPHYHINIIGWIPEDLRFFGKSKSSQSLYRSTIVEKLWKFGFVWVEPCDFKTAKYTAKYMQKYAITNDKLNKPFLLMSKGLGKDFATEKIIENKKIYYDGQVYPIPRYFMTKLEDFNGFEKLKEFRKKQAELRDSLIDVRLQNKKDKLLVEFIKAQNKEEEKYLLQKYKEVFTEVKKYDSIELEEIKNAFFGVNKFFGLSNYSQNYRFVNSSKNKKEV